MYCRFFLLSSTTSLAILVSCIAIPKSIAPLSELYFLTFNDFIYYCDAMIINFGMGWTGIAAAVLNGIALIFLLVWVSEKAAVS